MFPLFQWIEENGRPLSHPSPHFVRSYNHASYLTSPPYLVCRKLYIRDCPYVICVLEDNIHDFKVNDRFVCRLPNSMDTLKTRILKHIETLLPATSETYCTLDVSDRECIEMHWAHWCCRIQGRKMNQGLSLLLWICILKNFERVANASALQDMKASVPSCKSFPLLGMMYPLRRIS